MPQDAGSDLETPFDRLWCMFEAARPCHVYLFYSILSYFSSFFGSERLEISSRPPSMTRTLARQVLETLKAPGPTPVDLAASRRTIFFYFHHSTASKSDGKALKPRSFQAEKPRS